MLGQYLYSSYTYSLSKDKSEVFETITPTNKKPRGRRRPDLMDAAFGIVVLEDFLQIRRPEDLLKYTKRHGFPNRDQILQQIQEELKQYLQNKSRPDPDAIHIRTSKTEFFINLAASLRWLSTVICAIQEVDTKSLLAWTKSTYIPPKPGDDSRRPADIPPDAIEIILEPQPDSPEYKDYAVAVQFLSPYSSKYVFPSKWKALPAAPSREIAIQNVSEHINVLMQPIRIMLTTSGTPTFSARNHTDAMALALYNQLSGAQGLKVCRNPNCPTKFYLPKTKSKRKPLLRLLRLRAGARKLEKNQSRSRDTLSTSCRNTG